MRHTPGKGQAHMAFGKDEQQAMIYISASESHAPVH
jgi:hypothetical protein